MIRRYNFFEKIRLVISQENILIAHKNLIALSNSIQKNQSEDVRKSITESHNMEEKIKKALNIDS